MTELNDRYQLRASIKKVLISFYFYQNSDSTDGKLAIVLAQTIEEQNEALIMFIEPTHIPDRYIGTIAGHLCNPTKNQQRHTHQETNKRLIHDSGLKSHETCDTKLARMGPYGCMNKKMQYSDIL